MKNEEIKKILVVRIRRVGDALLTLPLLNSLKATFPLAKIDFVVNEPIDDLFAHQHIINRIIKIPRDVSSGSFFSYVKWVSKTMKKSDYDLVIDCRTTLKTMFFSLFSIRSKYRIGLKKKYNFFIHNKRVQADSKLTKIKEMCSLMEPLRSNYDIKEIFDLNLEVVESEISEAKNLLMQAGVNLNEPIIFCNVASRDVNKQFPIQDMIDLLRRITITYPSYQLILNYGSKSEKEVVESIYNSLDKKENVFHQIDMNSLRSLAAVLNISSFFWGNEGGARHIADALNIPSFSIFSSGISIDKWIMNRTDKNDAISVDEIMLKSDEENENKNDFLWSILEPKIEKLNSYSH